MPRFLSLICAVSWLCLGCGKSSAPPAAASAVASSEANLANVLAELTQALRRFSVEQRKVPASLNELIAAGYIKNLPQPPPGKTFGIDPKNLQVIVK